MKKNLFLLFCGLQMSAAYMQTNKYYNANESWTQTAYCTTMGQPWCIQTRNYFINGDSLINGKVYKKGFKLEREWTGSGFSSSSGSITVPAFVVKEENDTIEILYHHGGDTIVDYSIIHYDFTNSMMFWSYYISDPFPESDTIYQPCSSVYDSIVINGVVRRFFGGFGEIYEGVFANSWGWTFCPFTNPPQFDGYQQLQCYAGNDSVYIDYSGEIWPGWAEKLIPPVPGNCNIDSIYWSSIETIVEPEIIIFPNPSDEFIHIKLPPNLSIQKKLIVSSEGKEIDCPMDINNQMNVSNLPNGLYSIVLFIENGVYSKAFIKK